MTCCRGRGVRFGTAIVWLALAACRTERGAESVRRPETGSALGSRDDSEASRLTEADIVLDTVATGLEVPWALAFAPDGRIFVTERTGRVRVIERGALRPEPWATLPVVADGEAGLMGIAIAPDFVTSRAVYVVGTFESSAGKVNRVMRLLDRDGRGIEASVVLDGIPAASFHAGDAIAFGPDGMLYVATGDARKPGLAQEMTSLAGKILRLSPDGRVPRDNPTIGSPVYASGLRNVQGLAWDPKTQQLFATEHGPSGFPNERFRRNDDELNAIRAGGNYGWPFVAGVSRSARFVSPLVAWSPAVAPSGLAIYAGSDFPEWRGSLFVGCLRGEQLLRITVTPDSGASGGWRVTSEVPLFRTRFGRIRAVASGPDGRIYFTTSNRDGRGSPSRSDDRIFRLVRRR